MSNDVHKADNKGHIPADIWFLGRLLEIDGASLYKQLQDNDCITSPAVQDLEILCNCCDVEEIDVSDLPLVYKMLYFVDFRDQLLCAGDDGSYLLLHVQAKIEYFQKWFARHYPPTEKAPDLSGMW